MSEINCQALARRFLEEKATRGDDRTLFFAEGLFWEWKSTHYIPITDKELKNRILTWLTARIETFSRETWTWVCQNVISILMTDYVPELGVWLNPENTRECDHLFVACSNGIVDLGGLKPSKVPFTPRFLNRVAIPVRFDPAAKCPLWDRTLREWMDNDEERIAVLQEFVGYCLTGDVRFCVGLFLEGQGANGKTVFVDVLSDLLGEHNCDHVPIENFGKEFALETTPGKLVNISTETATGKLPSQAIKQFVDGNVMKITRKYHTAVSVAPTAKVIISWNERPKVLDRSHGFWRRIMLVPWERTFLPHEQDITIQEKLKGELPGILNWAIEGHRRLYKNHGFTKSKKIDEANRAFHAQSDPASSFLGKYCDVATGSSISKDDLYGLFVNWCIEHSYEPPAAKQFSIAVTNKYGSRVKPHRRRQGGARLWFWNNLRVQSEARDEYGAC